MKTAIIGAGPAGLYLAEKLARRGEDVSVFDPRAPWEKPCGGGLTPRVFREFPEILDLTDQWHQVRDIKVILSNGREVRILAEYPFKTISRKLLAEALLKRAREAGAEFFPEKVEDIVGTAEGFDVVTGSRRHSCGFLVGADGAGGITRRKLAGRFKRHDFCLAFSALIPSGAEMPLTIRLYSDMTGYAWIFPRKNQASIGIGAKGNRQSAGEMKQRLKFFAEQEFKRAGLEPPTSMALGPALLLSLSLETLATNRVAGPRWALIGDASGIVDPITGEGIYYAFKTAQILFESLTQDLGKRYQARIRGLAEESLWRSPAWCETFYKPASQKIWGYLFLRSTLVQQIITEILQNEQDYQTLKRRLLRVLPRALAQSLLSCIR